ncbi:MULTISPECIES: CoA transferase [unclassified Microbacterium]|uniref:CoA transferase n=1 Tax=unclassified Microbacterium TaxID=2609290 RepID=UPI0021A8B7CE|nr:MULTISPECIES: CoA transferase [unclassified Microbacterium]MCT1366238.1 CoA transferase [Microbacterium sp. p3-SID131]MCT1378126.1 CoA transferase [Microbacterium sp. p3-SID337]
MVPGRPTSAAELLARVVIEAGGDASQAPADSGLRALGGVPLSSRTATGDLALVSVAAVALAAGIDLTRVDPVRVAVAYRSDRYLEVGGTPPPVWAPLSGFWASADGWVRTHGNYPHHARALRSALDLDDRAGAEAVARTLETLHTAEAVRRISEAGGLAVAVRPEDRAADEALRRTPVVDVAITEAIGRRRGKDRRLPSPGAAGQAPLAGVRVLDLTRVIAGPVCTRTLALLGADVLRIDPPHLPELPWQHLDTGHGKRTALLDARGAALHDLLETADAVVLGYRPAALERLGLSPDALAARYPGLLVAQLSAWGTSHPERAGFDSLVQAESGIALIEGDGGRPGALPAQALDHSAGYLLAAALTQLLRHRDGHSRVVRTSLRRIAAELLGMPRTPHASALPEVDASGHLARFDVDGETIVTAAPALPGLAFDAPHGWGTDAPHW